MSSRSHSRTAFDTMLARNHAGRALIYQGHFNEAPLALCTFRFLRAPSSSLRTAYELAQRSTIPWSTSPSQIDSSSSADRHMGDVQYQEAYMRYFRLLHLNLEHSFSDLIWDEYLAMRPGSRFYGLFSEFGHALVHLSDAVETGNHMLLVESLTLAAVCWDPSTEALLASVMQPNISGALPARTPEIILEEAGYHPVFNGMMSSGPGFNYGSEIIFNEYGQTVLHYILNLEVEDQSALLDQLSELSVALACGTHIPGEPAFDYYLCQLPTMVQSLRVLLTRFRDIEGAEGTEAQVALIRGVWMLFVLAYLTQMRPVVDRSLITNFDAARADREDAGWAAVFAEVRLSSASLRDRYDNAYFWRTLRSIRELGRASAGGRNEDWYLRAALKLKTQWTGWVGLETVESGTINIRL